MLLVNQESRYTMFIVLLTSFVVPFMGSAVVLAVPAIGAQYGSNALWLSWVVLAYILSSAAFLLPFGRMADLIGRRVVFIWGLALFTVSTFLCCISWSIESLLLFRFLQGVGSSAMFSTGMAILTLAFTPQERGKMLGFNAAAVYVGLSAGPFVGGILNLQFGWPSIFLLTALLSLPVTILAFKVLQTDPVETGKDARFDWISAVLYSAGLGMLLCGISAIAEYGFTAVIIGVSGALLLFLFILRQCEVEQPMIDIKLFASNTVFAFSNLASLINYSATFAVSFILAIHLQHIMGFNSQIAGLIMISQPILMAIISPFAGTLSDRISPQIVASWGMGLTAAGLGLFVFITQDTPIWFIGANLALLGVGFALFASPNNNAIMSSVDRQHYGIAGSTMGTMRLVGQAASMALATLIINYYIGSVEVKLADPDMLIRSFKTIFSIFTVACICGIFASLARGKNSKLEV